MDENINRVADPIQWMLANVPGGNVAIVVLVVVAVIGVVLASSRGAPWAGPVAIVGSIAAVGVLNAVGIASAPVMVVMIALALLMGIAMLRVARVR